MGGTAIPEDCRNHDMDIAAATLTGALTIDGVPADPDANARLLLRNGPNDLVEIPLPAPPTPCTSRRELRRLLSASGPPRPRRNRLALPPHRLAVAPGGMTTWTSTSQ